VFASVVNVPLQFFCIHIFPASECREERFIVSFGWCLFLLRLDGCSYWHEHRHRFTIPLKDTRLLRCIHFLDQAKQVRWLQRGDLNGGKVCAHNRIIISYLCLVGRRNWGEVRLRCILRHQLDQFLEFLVEVGIDLGVVKASSKGSKLKK